MPAGVVTHNKISGQPVPLRRYNRGWRNSDTMHAVADHAENPVLQPLYGLLRFASFFPSDARWSGSAVAPIYSACGEALRASGPDGFPPVFIPIILSVWLNLGLSGLVKTPVRPFAIIVKAASQLGGKYSLTCVTVKATLASGHNTSSRVKNHDRSV